MSFSYKWFSSEIDPLLSAFAEQCGAQFKEKGMPFVVALAFSDEGADQLAIYSSNDAPIPSEQLSTIKAHLCRLLSAGSDEIQKVSP